MHGIMEYILSIVEFCFRFVAYIVLHELFSKSLDLNICSHASLKYL